MHLHPIDLRQINLRLGLDWLADHHVIPHAVIPKNWLIAKLMLVGCAGTAMVTVAYAFLNDDVRIADVAMIVRETGGEAAPRADRLGLASPADVRDLQEPIKSSVEQVDDRGIGTRRFVHIIAPLRSQEKASDALGLRVHPVPQTPAAPRALPREILFGASHPKSASRSARAYASAADVPDIWQPTAAGVPINVSVVAKSGHGEVGVRRLIVARHGDTLDRILSVLGVDDDTAGQIAALLTPHRLFRSNAFAGGEKIAVEFGPDRTSLRPLRVSLYWNEGARVAAALARDGTYVLTSAPSPAVWPHAEMLPGNAASAQPSVLRDSLYAVASTAHIARDAVSDVIAACAHDLDMASPAGADGKAELLYSSDDQGKPVIVYAAVRSDGKTDRYYRFLAPDSAGPEYYDAKGRAVPRPYLRKPVATGRLGDGFGWRIHPVLHDRRFHEGVDYAAPLGSPIMTSADGVVEKIGREWGYGKYIRVRHDSRFETTYAHIAGVAGGLKVGDHVRQGQTIAYVGSTGLSTGPHLYYEMRLDGRDVDPLHTDAVLGRSLVGTALADFEKVRARVDTLLAASMPSTVARR